MNIIKQMIIDYVKNSFNEKFLNELAIEIFKQKKRCKLASMFEDEELRA